MDKQREEFYKAYPRHEGILELYDAGSLQYLDALDAFGAVRDFMVWQAAQTAMQPEIKTLQVENKCLSNSCLEITIKYRDTKFHLSEAVKNYADIFNQLSAANQRNKELQSENETCRNLMRIKQEQNDAFSQRIAELLDLVEVVERRNKQLEAIIKASQEQEPYGYTNDIGGFCKTESVQYTPNWTDYYYIELYAKPVIIKERYSLWLIYFDDQDRRPEMFTDEGAALKRYEDISISWNAHLFVLVNSNSRDAEKYPPVIKEQP